MVLSDLLRYKIFKKYLLEKEFKNNFQSLIRESAEVEENVGNSSAKVLKTILSKLTNPTKVYEALQTEELKKVFDKVTYQIEEKKLLVNGEAVNEETKYFILLGVIIYYMLSLKENISSVDSPFLEKASEYLRGVAVSRVIINDVSINTEKVNEAFEKASSSIRLFGILVSALLILLAEHVKGGDSKSGVLKVIFKLINTLSESGDNFVMGIYYVLLTLKDFAGKTVYTDILADEVYNNCFAVGLTSVPIYVMKTKETQDTVKEPKSVPEVKEEQ